MGVGCWQWGFLQTAPEGPLALPHPHKVAVNVIGEHPGGQMSEALLVPAPPPPNLGKNLSRTEVGWGET